MARTAKPRMAERGCRMPRRCRGSGTSARISRRERGEDITKPPVWDWASPIYRRYGLLPRSTIELPCAADLAIRFSLACSAQLCYNANPLRVWTARHCRRLPAFGTIMKNFLRALRHALPYRRRLALSIFCAICAAAFWGANLSSIYPLLILLQYKQSPHDWINKKIEEVQKDVGDYQ